MSLELQCHPVWVTRLKRQWPPGWLLSRRNSLRQMKVMTLHLNKMPNQRMNLTRSRKVLRNVRGWVAQPYVWKTSCVTIHVLVLLIPMTNRQAFANCKRRPLFPTVSKIILCLKLCVLFFLREFDCNCALILIVVSSFYFVSFPVSRNTLPSVNCFYINLQRNQLYNFFILFLKCMYFTRWQQQKKYIIIV